MKTSFNYTTTPTLGMIPPVPPRKSTKPRMIIVGDYPYDAHAKQPFSASHWGSLKTLSLDAHVDVDSCMLTNIMDSFPHETNIKKLISSPEVQESFKRFLAYVEAFQPDVILAMGELPCKLLRPGYALDDARGSPYINEHTKKLTLHTLHPRQLFTRYSLRMIVETDIAKAHRLGKDGWHQKTYNNTFLPDFGQVMRFLKSFLDDKRYLSMDIETKHPNITCISLAWSATEAMCIPFVNSKGKCCWSLHEETNIWKLLSRVLEECPLIGQNAVHYDHGVLANHYGINCNFVDDTMLAQWSCYCELPKSLGFINNLYTDNPYHKDILKQARSGKIPYWREFEYCCYDTCTTLECAIEISKEMEDRPKQVKEHYKFLVRVSKAYQYMAMKGCLLDKPMHSARLEQLTKEAEDELESLRAEIGDDEFSPKSPKQVNHYLYDILKLPKKYKQSVNKSGDEVTSVTSDYLTVLYLARKYPNITHLTKLANVRKKLKRTSALAKWTTRKNGVLGWEHNVVGTVTGRASGKKPLDGLGIQPQNIDSRDKDLLKAPLRSWSPDAQMMWLKADLEGADSWTQAAQLKALKEPALMEDLLAGVKPAQRLAIAHLYGHEYMHADVEKVIPLLPELKATEKGKLFYGIMKAISHGSAYGMKKQTMHTTIFKQSKGDTYVEPSDCEKFQILFYSRYKFPMVHNYVRSKLNSDGFMDTADGARRYFLGRKDESTLRGMLSHAPQAHTGHVANTVIDRIFNWKVNRVKPSFPHLYLEPTNQVHDEIDGAFDLRDLAEVTHVLNTVWRVPITFWGQEFTIPFEVQYGPTWGDLPHLIELS